MYLIVIAWIYVVLMMSVAEATNTNGTLLGAIVTFFMYGVGPAALVAYLMSTPARKRAIKKREADEQARQAQVQAEPPPPPIASGRAGDEPGGAGGGPLL